MMRIRLHPAQGRFVGRSCHGPVQPHTLNPLVQRDFCGYRVPSCCEAEIDHLTFWVDSPPQVAPLAANPDADFHLELVGLSKCRLACPREFSGGMTQRTALARTLATEPGTLLMDEPFASIDAQIRELMQIKLMRIWMLRRPVVLPDPNSEFFGRDVVSSGGLGQPSGGIK